MASDEADDVRSLYANRFSGATEQRAAIWSVLARYFKRWVKATDTVLDLGAGYCEFINAIAAANKYALDLNPETKNRADPHVAVIEQSSTRPWPLDAGTIDVVFTSNFLEHLPDKAAVIATIEEARRVLKPNGLVIALGPNVRYLPGAYWDFFDHYVPLTDLSLAEILAARGFHVELRLPRFLPYTMSGDRRYPSWMVSAYLALPFAWSVLGKQFLVIARKNR